VKAKVTLFFVVILGCYTVCVYRFMYGISIVADAGELFI
jgi:hypothetical protein